MCYRDVATLYLRYRMILCFTLIINFHKISVSPAVFILILITLVARQDSVVPVQK